MKIFLSYKSLLKKSPLVRFLSIFIFLGIIILVTSILGKTSKRKPSISEISPMIGSPGDTMIIKGKDFGESKNSSYVEIAGSKLTSTAYISWAENEIQLKLPQNVQDGLVIVGTLAGRSEPEFFANKYLIPVAVKSDPQQTFPTITSITPANASIGESIVISGTNFGSTRGNSLVYFTANRDSRINSNVDQNFSNPKEIENTYICASTFDYDYELWSDNEIHIKVPDGADSGSVFVSTAKGDSSSFKINIKFNAGKKKYSNHRTYVVQITADISSNEPSQNSMLSLYVPRPAVSSLQPIADLNECIPEPLIADDQNDIIHQIQLNRLENNRQNFSQTFVVSSYSVESNINSKSVMPFQNLDSLIYKIYTGADSCIQSENSAIKNLANSIVGRERYPVEKARLIYNYILDNYEILEKSRFGEEDNISQMIQTKKGDAYDFAIMFTTLCRAAEIPAIPVSGILIENNSQTRVHWWTELYFEKYGWFPVDVALASGLDFESFKNIENPASYFFGNLDNQHIAFSRGWNQIKPSLFNSKIVYRPRTYALQSIWEESGDSTSSYSSLWNNPVVIGIY